MRILVIHNRYLQYGGEDATFESEVRLLKQNRHDVEVLIFDNHLLDSLVEKIKSSYNLFYNRQSEKKVRQIIEKFNPDVIHVHNFFYVASPSIFYAARRSKTPIVVTLQNFRLICSGALLMRSGSVCELCVYSRFPFQGVIHRCHKNSSLQTALLTLVTGFHKLIGTWIHQVSHYVAVTEFTRQKYINSSLNISASKISVKPNSVKDFGIGLRKERKDYFLYIGRLSKEKGIDILLAAFRDVKYTLHIIGDGPERQKVIEEAVVNSAIVYHGYQGKEFIIEKLKKCKALVFPSVWYECLPITILEAFSTGTPVIISDIGNLNTIVTDNFNGLHFNKSDIDSLQSALGKIYEGNVELSYLYANARKTYESNYSEIENYKRLISIYSKLLYD